MTQRKAAKVCDLGQTFIEMTFAVVVTMFIIFGLVQAARWVVMDTVERRSQHDLMVSNFDLSGEAQLNPKGARVRRIDMEYRNAAN